MASLVHDMVDEVLTLHGLKNNVTFVAQRYSNGEYGVRLVVNPIGDPSLHGSMSRLFSLDGNLDEVRHRLLAHMNIIKWRVIVCGMQAMIHNTQVFDDYIQTTSKYKELRGMRIESTVSGRWLGVKDAKLCLQRIRQLVEGATPCRYCSTIALKMPFVIVRCGECGAEYKMLEATWTTSSTDNNTTFDNATSRIIRNIIIEERSNDD